MVAPTVPILQDSATLETRTSRQRSQASPEAFGAAEGRAAGALSESLGRAAAAAEEIDQRFDSANARELDNALTNALIEDETAFLNRRGVDALKERQPMLARVDERIAELAVGARSPRALSAFQTSAAQRRAGVVERATNHANQQLRVYENELSGARIAASLRMAETHFQDDVEVLQQLGLAGAEARTAARRNGQAPEIAEQAATEQREAVAASVLALRTQLDPSAMLQALRADPPQGLVAMLSPNARAALLNHAETEVRQRAALWRSSVHDDMRGAVALMELGEAPINAPSVETVRAALGENQAAAYEIQVQTYSAGSRLQSMSNADLAALATAAPVQEGSEREQYARAVDRRAASNILTLRNADPMANAVRQGLVTNTADVTAAIQQGDFSSLGEILRRRVGVAIEQSREVGTAPLPLTRTEATQLRQTLDRLPPAARVQALNILREGAAMPRRGDGGAYVALLGQIYADNPGALAGAVASVRSGAPTSSGRIDGETVGRRMLAGAALLHPPPVEYDNQGRAVERQPSVDLPSPAALQGAFNAYVGDAYAGDQEGYERAFQAFRSYYVGAAIERGVNGAGLSFASDGRGGGTPTGDGSAVDLAGEAAQVAVGQLRTNAHGGVPGLPAQTYLPWGMTEDLFMESLRQGWPSIRQRYDAAELGEDPDEYDYGRDANGFYTVFYRGVAVPDGEGGFVRVRPRSGQ